MIGLFRKNHQRKFRRFALRGIAEAHRIELAGVPAEKVLEIVFARLGGLRRQEDEAVLDLAARYFRLTGDQLRQKVEALAAGGDPKHNFPGNSDPIEKFYLAIGAMYLALMKEKEK